MTMMTTTETPFVAACRALFNATALGKLTWRHHGLGMLQAELTETLRIHLWHPRLRVMAGMRAVHDHRFDITSAVLHGSIEDVCYDVAKNDLPARVAAITGLKYTRNVPVNQVQHAKVQSGTSADFKFLWLSAVAECCKKTHDAGAKYDIPRRRFHTTRVTDMAVTVIHRSNFDDEPARVLGEVGDVIDGVGGKTVSGIVATYKPSREPLPDNVLATLDEALSLQIGSP